MIPAALADWLATHRQIVLITVRRDGTPQSSNVIAGFDRPAELFEVSVTADRAKTHNLRRNPAALVHVLGDSFWSYASVRVRAELTDESKTPGDEPGRELLDLYNRLSSEPHPDPAEYLQAMVDDRRLIARLHVLDWVAPGIDGA